jgi:hypothetical protein
MPGRGHQQQSRNSPPAPIIDQSLRRLRYDSFIHNPLQAGSTRRITSSPAVHHNSSAKEDTSDGAISAARRVVREKGRCPPPDPEIRQARPAEFLFSIPQLALVFHALPLDLLAGDWVERGVNAADQRVDTDRCLRSRIQIHHTVVASGGVTYYGVYSSN